MHASVIRTGARLGLVYALAGYALELVLFVGLFPFLSWQDLLPDLAWLGVQYAVFGAGLGALVALALAGVLRYRPPARGHSAVVLLVLTALYVLLLLLWTPISVVPRAVHALLPPGILVFVGVLALCAWLARRLLRSGRRTRPLARPLVRAALAGLLLAAGIGLAVSLARSWRPAAPAAPARPAASGRPNIVLVVLDTVRAQNLSSYGYPRQTTPHLDAIAAEGVLYQNAYSTEAWTLPAHASLFTGQWAGSHGAHNEHLFLGSRAVTLAELLTEHGYRSAGFSANPWLSENTGLVQGFEHFDHVGLSTVVELFFLNLVKHAQKEDLGGAEVEQRLVRWIDAQARSNSGQPFFAFANFMEAHEPYGTVPEPYFSLYQKQKVERTFGKVAIGEMPLFLCGLRSMTPELHESLIALYDAGIRYLDERVFGIYEALRRHGLLENTVFVVTSDHGENFGDNGLVEHGFCLYDTVLRVPLIVRYPPRFAPRTLERAPVQIHQLFPTLLELAGVPVPDASVPTARSLLEAQHLQQPVVAEHYNPRHMTRAMARTYRCDFSRYERTLRSVERAGKKFIWASDGRHELYDTQADPAEARDLHAAEPTLAVQFSTELEAWSQLAAREASDEAAPELDEGTKAVLKNLGYVR